MSVFGHGVEVCTSTTRPTPTEGLVIFETDTKLMLFYDGTVWQRFHPSGSVIQSVFSRFDTRTSISVTASGGSATQLGLTITPRYSNSKILLQWMINGEGGGSSAAGQYNHTWVVFKNGSVMTSPAGYNTQYGNVQYSGVAFGNNYDPDFLSTPKTTFIQFLDDNLGGTSSRVYTPAIKKSSTDADGAFILNGAFNNVGNGFEVGVSNGVAMEIMA